MDLVSIKVFIDGTILSATVSNLYSNNYLLAILYISGLVSINNCSVYLYNGEF